MAGMFEGSGAGAGAGEIRLVMARLDAIERMVLSLTREHLAQGAGMESRLAAIESALSLDLRLAELAKKTPPGGGGDAIAFRHEYMDTAAGEAAHVKSARIVERSTGYIQWRGGEPRPAGLRNAVLSVVFKTADGAFYTDTITVSHGYEGSWEHTGNSDRIVAFKVIDPAT